ncbi:MAG: 5-methyltetrahydropteroyltriglutamate--homocysteine S-methyltransferase [Acuticoccus sp.]
MPPPHRADHVGSLLRPAAVADARRRHAAGELSDDALKAVEDAAIRDVVQMQQDVGLKVATDGEMRRSFWHYDFMAGLDGLVFVEREADAGIKFKGANTRPIVPTITGPIDFPADHPMLDHFGFLASVADVTPKISIPGPSVSHFRVAREDIFHAPYREDAEAMFADLTATYRKAVAAFHAAGCRYLQMDDIYFAYLCDPKIRAEKMAAGLDPDWLIDRYAQMMREAIEGRPDDMLIAMHMCRGNFRSTWIAEGAYDPAADAIFNKTGVDLFFMEYDTERAGGLAPLRLLAKGRQRVYPGFITTKTGELETLDDLKRKLDEAARHADLDQLGIAPQCGFASTEEGNAIDVDHQRRKLALVVETAEAVWASA